MLWDLAKFHGTILATTKMISLRETYTEWLARRDAEKRKKEFKSRLKYGKPRGNTRPPFRLGTDDPGPH